MRYLRENPDFFGRHPMLLTDLSLPHDSGEAISLVERQVAILRERNIDMRRRLTHLVGAANTNDTLFEKTRRFTLNMLDCDDLDDHRRRVGRHAHRRFRRRPRALLRLASPCVRVRIVIWSTAVSAQRVATAAAHADDRIVVRPAA